MIERRRNLEKEFFVEGVINLGANVTDMGAGGSYMYMVEVLRTCDIQVYLSTLYLDADFWSTRSTFMNN